MLGLALGSILTLNFSTEAFAQVPRLISYQGQMLSSGQPFSGQATITVNYYEGSALAYTEVFNSVQVVQGIFNITLGSTTGSFPVTLDFTGPVSIGVSINGGGELSPRTLLAASAYALNASTVGGFAASAAPTAGQLLVLDGTGKVPTSALPPAPAPVNIVAGDNIDVVQNGNTFTISAEGGSGGGGTITGVLAGRGLVGGGTSGVVSLALAEGALTADDLANGSITGFKLNNLVAGHGLYQDNAGNISVGVDNETIRIVNDKLEVWKIGVEQIDADVQRIITQDAPVGSFLTGVNQNGTIRSATVKTDESLVRTLDNKDIFLRLNTDHTNVFTAEQIFEGGITTNQLNAENADIQNLTVNQITATDFVVTGTLTTSDLNFEGLNINVVDLNASGNVTLGNGTSNTITINAGDGPVSLSGSRLQNVGTPQDPTDAVNVEYLDTRLGTQEMTGDITGTFDNTQVNPASEGVGDRIVEGIHNSSSEVNDEHVANNLTIDGGTVDASPIGSMSPSSGVFTELTSTSTTNLGTDPGVDVIIGNGEGFTGVDGFLQVFNGLSFDDGSDVIGEEVIAFSTGSDRGIGVISQAIATAGNDDGNPAATGVFGIANYFGDGPDDSGDQIIGVLGMPVPNDGIAAIGVLGQATLDNPEHPNVGVMGWAGSAHGDLGANIGVIGAVNANESQIAELSEGAPQAGVYAFAPEGTALMVNGVSDFMDNRIRNVASPEDGTDAVNRDYVDMAIMTNDMDGDISGPPSGTQINPASDGIGDRLVEGINASTSTLDDAVITDALTVDGGMIEGTPIGASTPSTAAFTDLSSSGTTMLGTESGSNVTIGNADGTTEFTGTVDLTGSRLENVGSPVDPNDAVTLEYLENTFGDTEVMGDVVGAFNATEIDPASVGIGDRLIEGITASTSEVADANIVDGLTIDGGTIDATPIGSTTASTGMFTELTSVGETMLASEGGNVVIGTTDNTDAAALEVVESLDAGDEAVASYMRSTATGGATRALGLVAESTSEGSGDASRPASNAVLGVAKYTGSLNTSEQIMGVVGKAEPGADGITAIGVVGQATDVNTLTNTGVLGIARDGGSLGGESNVGVVGAANASDADLADLGATFPTAGVIGFNTSTTGAAILAVAPEAGTAIHVTGGGLISSAAATGVVSNRIADTYTVTGLATNTVTIYNSLVRPTSTVIATFENKSGGTIPSFSVVTDDTGSFTVDFSSTDAEDGDQIHYMIINH